MTDCNQSLLKHDFNRTNETTVGSMELKIYLKRIIGKGSFGRVKYCVAMMNERPVSFAVKIIDKLSTVYQRNRMAIDREISIIEMIRHVNLVTCFSVAHHHHNVYIFMEYCK